MQNSIRCQSRLFNIHRRRTFAVQQQTRILNMDDRIVGIGLVGQVPTKQKSIVRNRTNIDESKIEYFISPLRTYEIIYGNGGKTMILLHLRTYMMCVQSSIRLAMARCRIDNNNNIIIASYHVLRITQVPNVIDVLNTRFRL